MLAKKYFEHFGTVKGLHYFGYLMLLGVAGMRTAQELADAYETEPLERTTWWKVMHGLKEFGRELKDEGWYIEGDPDEDIKPLARMLYDALQGAVGVRKQVI